MEDVAIRVFEFKKRYPLTIGWRIRKNSSVVEKHLNPNEKILYCFIAQKNDNPFNLIESAVVALTTERIVIGRKRLIFGYYLDSITPDLFNDLKVTGGIIWGKIFIDTIKEFVTLSNISNNALPEIESAISAYMIEQKKKLYKKKSLEDDE